MSEKCGLSSSHECKQPRGDSVSNSLKTTPVALLFCPQAAVWRHMPVLSFAPLSKMSTLRRPPWLYFCLCAKQVEAVQKSQWEPLFYCSYCHQLLDNCCRPLWHTFKCKQTKTAGWRNVRESTGGTVFQAVYDVMGSVEVSLLWIQSQTYQYQPEVKR